jgi:uncharacterized protein (TIGR02594 family)
MPSDDIKRIQQALKHEGFNPGDIDGIWGRASIGALKRFQAKAGLEVDGIPGPKSRAALFGAPALSPTTNSPSDLVWFQEALNLVGTDELPGPGSNKTIIKWAKDLDIDFPRDDVAWCGLFVAHCVGSTLTDEPLPTAPLGAQNWKHFGDSCAPKLGAVLVFWRENKSSWKGHVGFYRGEDDNAYHVIGGNQSDTVNTTRIAKHRLIAARWPKTAAALTSTIVVAAAEGDMGHKEH